MFIELIDLLRCTRQHEDAWLVAAFTKLDQRFVFEGTLGCHVCGASYPVHDGIVNMRDSGKPDADRFPDTGSVQQVEKLDPPSADDAVRFAALLGLTRPGALIVMEGESALLAPVISEMTESRVIALNPPGGLNETERVALVLSGARIPLAPGSVDGVVAARKSVVVADAARVLKPGGRLVADASADPGGSFREITRDDRHVVAESIGPLISLKR